MPVFEYKGVTAAGKKVSGVQDGEGLKAVKTKLKKEGVIVLEIREGSSMSAARRGNLSFSFGSIVFAATESTSRASFPCQTVNN